MSAQKSKSNQDPLLNVVARKVGHAAGALSKVTHKLLGQDSIERTSTAPERTGTAQAEDNLTASPALRHEKDTAFPTPRPVKKKARSSARKKSAHPAKTSTGHSVSKKKTQSPRKSN